MTDLTTNEPLVNTATAPASGGLLLASYTLWRREMVRFFRQRNRVVSALATPIVFWLLLGFGLQGSFSLPGADAAANGAGMSYLQYYFPGTVVLIVLFTAIFSTISVIEDRREGFLQGVLVAPVSRLSIVLGKVLGGASIATIQGGLFVLLWPLLSPISHTPLQWVGVLAASLVVLFVLGVGLTTLGLCLAWPMDSTAGFHAVMNLLLMPMWFLSGALFPMDGAPLGMRMVMWMNPLTYGQLSLSSAMLGRTDDLWAASWPMLVFVGFTLVLLWFCARMVRRPSRR